LSQTHFFTIPLFQDPMVECVHTYTPWNSGTELSVINSQMRIRSIAWRKHSA
jgi:hypothetical protein